MTTVFISYAREDIANAERLYEEIRILNTKVWLDTKSLKPGQVWEEVIVSVIHRADVFVALVSRTAFAKRSYMQKEVNIALSRLRKDKEALYVIPTRLDDVDLASSKMARLGWIDLFPDWNVGVEQIKTCIKGIVGSQGKSIGGIDFDSEDLHLQIERPSNLEKMFGNED